MIESDSEAILIDAGISRKRIVEALKRNDVPLNKVKGIFITHTHSDHISGLPILKKYINAPHYATGSCINSMYDLPDKEVSWQELAKSTICITKRKIVQVGNFKIITLDTQHDSPGTVGYRIHLPIENSVGVTVSILTDTGSLNSEDIERISKSDVILLESNYNKELLKKSNRPIQLKNRIQKYHMSNDYTSEILELVTRFTSSTRIKGMILGHLSGECNDPDLVREWVRKWQHENDASWNWYLAPRDNSSDLITVSPTNITEKKFAGFLDY